LAFSSVEAGTNFVQSYIVYTDVAPGKAIMKSKGYQNDRQPILVTRVFQPRNTDYYLVDVSTEKPGHIQFFDGLVSSGKIDHWRTIVVTREYDGRTGGVLEEVSEPVYHMNLPSDWDRDWTEVAVSSK